MASLAELTTKLDGINSAVTNIRQDISDIKASLPAAGGLTADEVAALDARLTSVLAAAQALDAENPSTPSA